jgi:hypothetical protein
VQDLIAGVAIVRWLENDIGMEVARAGLQKKGLEILGGQDWTLFTPNRKGLSHQYDRDVPSGEVNANLEVVRNVRLIANTLFGSGGGRYLFGLESAADNNRTVQDARFDLVQTFWKNPKYGALSVIAQYSYLSRDPWSIPSSGARYTKTIWCGWIFATREFAGS